MQESANAARAYADYLALGPERSLSALLDRYRSASEAPTRRLKTLADWSRHHDWQGRLRALARQRQLDAEFAERERQRQLLTTGLATAHERVARLARIADLLELDLTGDKLWLQDYKTVAKVAMPIERPNAAWVRQYRGLLDDIAREVGQRKPKDEDGPAGGVPDERAVALMSDAERGRRVAELLERGRARGAGPAAQPAGTAP